MVWGTIGGNGLVKEDLLEPLGLYSYGGGTNQITGAMTYDIMSRNDDFEYTIDWKDIDQIGDIYTAYLRKHKINKITGEIR